MADFIIKFKADELGKSIENLAPEVEAQLNQAVADLANAAYSSILDKVQNMGADPKNRQDYIRALNIDKLSETDWLISLDSEAAQRLEDGYGPYSIKDQLLASTKTVTTGSRSGEKWVQVGKDGNRYAAVPFQHRPSSKATSGDLAADIKKMTAINASGTKQKLTKIFKDIDGKPLSGKVATSTSKIANLNNMTKYQYVNESGSVSSVYMTFRMVSDKSTGWQHPGFGGYQIFKEAEEYVERELENIIKNLL